MYKVRTYNQISVKGLDRFPRQSYEVGSDIGHPDAFLLRSQKLQGVPVPESLLAVARAGAGVNNVPIAEYSKLGIVVFNTPGANANAVKELVMAGMLLATRGILPGMAYVQSLTHMTDAAEMSALLEKEKSRFAGGEIKGKTLGIVGLGAIGSMVAEMALAMGMKVVGFDPALSIDAAWRLSNEVTRMENLPALLARSDYVSLHVPAMDATRHLINADSAGRHQARRGAAELCARNHRRLGRGAALPGRRPARPLRLRLPRARDAGPRQGDRHAAHWRQHRGVRGKLCGDGCQPAHGLPGKRQHHQLGELPRRAHGAHPEGTTRISFSNDNVSGVLGHVLSVLAEHKVNVVDMMNKSRGELAFNIIDVESRPDDAVAAAIQAVEHVIRVRVI
jgi:D-3-phosphoglycerate dehydrogenase